MRRWNTPRYRSSSSSLGLDVNGIRIFRGQYHHQRNMFVTCSASVQSSASRRENMDCWLLLLLGTIPATSHVCPAWDTEGLIIPNKAIGILFFYPLNGISPWKPGIVLCQAGCTRGRVRGCTGNCCRRRCKDKSRIVVCGGCKYVCRAG